MRRKRYQNGSLRPRKHGQVKVWVAQWRENGSKRSKVLGRCAEISKSQAKVMLAQIVEPLNEFAGQRRIAVSTFKQYVETVFLPTYRQKWKESTRSTSEPDILRNLVPAFADRLMETITREDMQEFLREKAKQFFKRCGSSSLALECDLQDGRKRWRRRV